MREIVFDTETTGLSPETGDRVVEIGAVELVNRYPTGRVFHVYLNPERAMPEAAFNVHGLSDEFLRDKPVFAAVADEFAAFFGEDGNLVAHNARFDLGFLNAELARLNRPKLDAMRVVDTVALARRRHPGAPASLDALCSRYGIDTSKRTKHGALLDAELLLEVYVELLGGRQSALDLARGPDGDGAGGRSGPRRAQPRPTPLPPRLTAAEAEAHAEFVKSLGENALWRRYEA